MPKRAEITVLAGEADATNDSTKQSLIEPKTFSIGVASSFSYAAPANSLSVIRIHAGR